MCTYSKVTSAPADASACHYFSIGTSITERPSFSIPSVHLQPFRVDERILNSGFDHSIRNSSNTLRSNGDLIQNVFASGPFKNAARAEFLRAVTTSFFLLKNQLESIFESDEGQSLLGKVSWIPNCPSTHLMEGGDSIYMFLVDVLTRRGLICEFIKTTLGRAVACIRSHLDHRPFVCSGSSRGCLSCPKRQERVVKRISGTKDTCLNSLLTRRCLGHGGSFHRLRRKATFNVRSRRSSEFTLIGEYIQLCGVDLNLNPLLPPT